MAKKHLSKELDNLIDKAIALGCRIERNGGTAKVFPPKSISNQFYTLHFGPTALHPLRRFLKNKCNFNV